VGLIATGVEQDLSIALSMLNRAIELNARFEGAYAYKGFALRRRYFNGWNADEVTLREALSLTERALDLDPASAVARLSLIRIYWDLGRFEDALREGRRAVRDWPDEIDSLNAMARAYTNAGMADKAAALIDRVLEADPTNPPARKLLIWGRLLTGNYEHSADEAKRYLSQHKGDSNTAWVCALALAHLHRVPEAITTARTGLHADRSNYTLWLLLGHLHRIAGDDRPPQKPGTLVSEFPWLVWRGTRAIKG
jgi:tetratricopeptide (TPR) repeat protein